MLTNKIYLGIKEQQLAWSSYKYLSNIWDITWKLLSFFKSNTFFFSLLPILKLEEWFLHIWKAIKKSVLCKKYLATKNSFTIKVQQYLFCRVITGDQ